jgi:hypothetical protein
VKAANLHRALRYLLGVGTVAYAVVSAMQPKRFAELTEWDEERIQELAKRDAISGVDILLGASPTMPLVSRAFYDFNDGVKLMRSRPSVAWIAFAWGVLALLTLLTRPSEDAAS